MKTIHACILSMTLIAVGAVLADLPPGFPKEMPDYAGVAASNFWEKCGYRDDNPQGDYVMPKIDPKTAIVVDQDGKGGKPADDNAGTAEAPLKTIGAAIKRIKPGAVVLIRGGVYQVHEITLAKEQAGTPEQPVLISAWPGEKVELTATLPVSGWQKREDGLWTAPLPAFEGGQWGNLHLGDRILLDVGQYLEMTTFDKAHRKLGHAPQATPPLLPADYLFAIQDGKLLLRLPEGADPNKLDAAISTGTGRIGTGVQLNSASHVIFNRLTFRRLVSALDVRTAGGVVLRYCVFQNNTEALTGTGFDAMAPMFIDRCCFEGTLWQNIYCLMPMTVRYSLFRNMLPNQAALTAYNSKHDAYHHVMVIGNTFLQTGACIYLTPGDSVARHNLAYSSRFVSCSGTRNVVEQNFVVYDPRDEAIAKVPRRDIGMRLYSYDSAARDNTFIGFSRGLLVNGVEGKAAVTGNRFYGYDDYGIIVRGTNGLEIAKNLFVPAKPELPVLMTEIKEGNSEGKHPWDRPDILAANQVDPKAKPPAIPQVIREAMAANPYQH